VLDVAQQGFELREKVGLVSTGLALDR
jgi:hypothetical protein